jgi:hypothetical protein
MNDIKTENEQFEFNKKKAAWETWHSNNPQIWEYFEKFTLDAIKANKSKISHWLIINRIRWETSIVTTGSDFKISNNFIAFYARKWKEVYPQYEYIFCTKKMVGEAI